MTDRPRSQILTFLFTDLENSTPLWEKAPERMQAVSARHDELLRAAFAAHRGRVVKTTGDGFHVVFDSPADGIAAALAGQAAIAAEPWPDETGPIRARMGLHTGESRERGGDYYGPELNRAARVMGIGHGGQILVSAVTAALVRGRLPDGAGLLDLGKHRLRGLEEPEGLYQVVHPDLPAEFPPLASAIEIPHNLPTQLTNFVGRERELAEIEALMSETRLLTLLGPGGTGKTRLMIQAGTGLIDRFPDGVWLIELAPLADPNQVVEKVAGVLGVREQPGRSLPVMLTGYLRRREALILLDNVEHLVAAAAELAETLLIGCPQIRILVTGRESLFIAGETAYQVPSLSLPDKAGASAAEIGESEAVQLFLDRARMVRRDFALTPANAAPVAEIVRRLDGIPLALELAAARLRVMSPEQIAERLNDRFRLLVGGRRTALPRQQTLQALIDWSWNLLEAEEQVLLRRLSVFSGGWRLEDAARVAGDDRLDEFAVLDGLEALVNKSLVVVENPGEGGERYRFLESIRQYALDRLFESGEGETFRDRHAEHFASKVAETEQILTATGFIEGMRRIAMETDNFRSAVDWLEDRRPLEMVALVGNLLGLAGQGHWWFPPAQSRRWLDRAIETGRTTPVPDGGDAERRLVLGVALGARCAVNFVGGRHLDALADGAESIALLREANKPVKLAAALASCAFANAFLGRLEEARTAGGEARALAWESGNLSALGLALGALGAAALMGGDLEAAEKLIEEGKSVSERLGGSWISLQFWVMEGRYLTVRGDLEQARARYEQAERTFEDLGERSQLMIVRSELSHILRRLGVYDEAVERYIRTIRYFRDVGHEAAIAHTLECFAYIAIVQEEPDRAAALLGAAQALRERSNNPITIPWEQADFDRALDQLGEMLGPEARDAALEKGRAMSTDDAVDYAVQRMGE